MKGYVSGKSICRPKETGIVKLNSNESHYGHPSDLQVLLSRQYKNDIAYYPSTSHEYLISAVAHLHSVKPSQIIITSGSSEAISLIVMSLAKLNQEVITSTHAFQLYAQLANLYQRHLILVPETQGWHQNLSAIKTFISDQTAIIFLSNPCNPLGTSISTKVLHNFIKSVPNHVTLVVDEAYAELMGDCKDYQSVLNLTAAYDNLVVTRTFSKLYALAGLRIGYAVASEGLVEKMRDYQLPFSVNQVASEAAAICLEHQPYYNQVARLIIESRQHYFHLFQEMGFEPFANTANFLTIDIKCSAEKFAANLEAVGIYIRPLSDYQLPTCLRISIGTVDEMSQFLVQFSSLIKNRVKRKPCI